MRYINYWKKEWHQFWLGYNRMIIADCLDGTEMTKIKKKMDYHSHQLALIVVKAG